MDRKPPINIKGIHKPLKKANGRWLVLTLSAYVVNDPLWPVLPLCEHVSQGRGLPGLSLVRHWDHRETVCGCYTAGNSRADVPNEGRFCLRLARSCAPRGQAVGVYVCLLLNSQERVTSNLRCKDGLCLPVRWVDITYWRLMWYRYAWSVMFSRSNVTFDVTEQ